LTKPLPYSYAPVSLLPYPVFPIQFQLRVDAAEALYLVFRKLSPQMSRSTGHRILCSLAFCCSSTGPTLSGPALKAESRYFSSASRGPTCTFRIPVTWCPHSLRSWPPLSVFGDRQFSVVPISFLFFLKSLLVVDCP